MEDVLKQLVESIERTNEKYRTSDTKQKIWLRLVMLILNPCLFVLKLKLHSVVKLILTILTALIMFGVTIVILPFYFLWYIWTNTNLKKSGKITITVIIVLTVLLGYTSIGQQISTMSFKPHKNTNDSNLEDSYANTESENNTDSTSSYSDEVKEPYTVDDSTKENVTEGVTKETTTIVQQTISNDFIQLSNNKEAYLLLLEILGNCYENYKLSESVFAKMQENQTVANLVKEVLDYKAENNEILPDFNESFSLFWSLDIANNNPEIITALQKSFNVSYDVINDIWLLTDKKDKETTTEFKWLSAIGNLYSGVELYIVTDNTTTLYGVVTDYDTKLHRVQVYLKEADSFMWFPTREESFLNKLKVRSDDPRLPN